MPPPTDMPPPFRVVHGDGGSKVPWPFGPNLQLLLLWTSSQTVVPPPPAQHSLETWNWPCDGKCDLTEHIRALVFIGHFCYSLNFSFHTLWCWYTTRSIYTRVFAQAAHRRSAAAILNLLCEIPIDSLPLLLCAEPVFYVSSLSEFALPRTNDEVEIVLLVAYLTSKIKNEPQVFCCRKRYPHYMCPGTRHYTCEGDLMQNSTRHGLLLWPVLFLASDTP